MASRDDILARLRQAAPVDVPGLPDHSGREIFRDALSDREDLRGRFEEQLRALSGEVITVVSEEEGARQVRELLESAEEGPWITQSHPLLDSIWAHDGELADSIAGADRLGLPAPEMAAYMVGISACDYLVARTGSIVLGSHTAGGRRLSVLPPFHIVIARMDQLIFSLDEAFERLGESEAWSYSTIITGPSRTADIEKILVLGAHGPKRLAVVIIR